MAIKTLKIIHAFLILSLAAFAAFTFFGGPGFVNEFSMENDIFIYVVPIVAMVGYFASKYMYSRELAAINTSEDLKTKLALYQKANILKFALLEGPAFLAFLQFMSNGYTLYFTIGTTLLLYLAMQSPSKTKTIEELSLNTIERESL
ncbi:hypothetical protein H0I25_12815 [Cellulophaga sp. HaHa_2_95]|uniref:hypothetical protein n=1 Tax=unclassified Cellulophaga TaxID=2634405 RepID=UPI001C4E7998|nr:MULTISPECIES: hypothetical protein [unclassified Cellulophaga]QXP52754.1 hypothetical protein H0I24_02175 [Cellulophaga sp. HaHa_2_1]QXP54962.1 hypothetical protein H0I25_12815 [Cellulophaga sp. HaHa_2_95]